MLQDQSMINKLVFVLLGIFSVIGCSINSDDLKQKEESNERDEKSSYYQLLLKEVDGMLPISLNRDDYCMIFRYGSIEFSSDYSVLCIPKKEINKSQIHCKYFMINNIEKLHSSNPELESDEPNILGFSFLLKNNSTNKISLNKLKRYDADELDIYVSNEILKRPGEGHCNNFYFITSNNKDSLYVLDLNSNVKEKAYFEHLYKQISSSEYLQTFSLNDDCNVNKWNLYIELNTSEKYKDSFILKHGEKGRYW